MSALCLADRTESQQDRTGQDRRVNRTGQDWTGLWMIKSKPLVYIWSSTELAHTRIFHTLFCDDQRISDSLGKTFIVRDMTFERRFTPPGFMCHMLGVTCQLSHVPCRLSPVIFYFLFVGGGHCGEACWWSVCYQRHPSLKELDWPPKRRKKISILRFLVR